MARRFGVLAGVLLLPLPLPLLAVGVVDIVSMIDDGRMERRAGRDATGALCLVGSALQRKVAGSPLRLGHCSGDQQLKRRTHALSGPVKVGWVAQSHKLHSI
jgi:hypothetical protein